MRTSIAWMSGALLIYLSASLAFAVDTARMSAAGSGADAFYVLEPARVFDGINPTPHEGWRVLV
ncbi:hypothetical protein ABTL41_19790, partial [Acinetobacter baumannii]